MALYYYNWPLRIYCDSIYIITRIRDFCQCWIVRTGTSNYYYVSLLVLVCCRPTEFLPHEYSGIHGIEQKMYKEQEILKMKGHKDIKANYNAYCSKLQTYDAVFFLARVSDRARD